MVRKKSKRIKHKTIRSRNKTTTHIIRRPISPMSSMRLGHALGLTSVIALLFYTVMAWFSTYDSTLVTQKFPLSFSIHDWTILIGIVQTYVLSYIAGWIIAKAYNHGVDF